MKALNAHIETFSNLGFSYENMHKRTSILGFLPIQANTNIDKDDNGVERFWCQLVANYKTSYTRRDEHGEFHDDNASIKTIFIKFPMNYLQAHSVSSGDFKAFFDDHYCGQKFLFLPVTEERQKFEQIGKNRMPIKNNSECTIDQSFDISSFFKSHFEKVGAKKS